MPRMHGFELIRRLHEVNGCRHTAILIISGFEVAASRATARELGVYHYLTKPVELGRLLEAMGELLHFDSQDPAPHTPRMMAEIARANRVDQNLEAWIVDILHEPTLTPAAAHSGTLFAALEEMPQEQS